MIKNGQRRASCRAAGGSIIRQATCNKRVNQVFGQEISTLSFWSVALLISIVLLFIVGQISRFYAMFQEHRREMESNIIGLSGQIKRLQGSLAELLVEVRRANRLQVEMLDMKRAELTGDFEVVNEPIPDGDPRQGEAAKAESGGSFPELEEPAAAANLAAPPRHFPKLDIN